MQDNTYRFSKNQANGLQFIVRSLLNNTHTYCCLPTKHVRRITINRSIILHCSHKRKINLSVICLY